MSDFPISLSPPPDSYMAWLARLTNAAIHNVQTTLPNIEQIERELASDNTFIEGDA